MKTVCVFCGSSPGRNPKYVDAAKELGIALTSRHIDLVYGGASIGVMGAVADTVLQNGGKVFGVIPKHLMVKERVHSDLTELHIVEDMHQRKAMMGRLSDGFIALPGGLGTLEELFEVLTWNQLDIHDKPVGLLNVCGYYDLLNQFLDYTVAEKFTRISDGPLFSIESDCHQIVDTMISSANKP